jgi:hypothetical protein
VEVYLHSRSAPAFHVRNKFTLSFTMTVGTLLVAQLVEAMRYKPGSRGFDYRRCHWDFQLINPSGHTMAVGSTQPLTDMSNRNISWG